MKKEDKLKVFEGNYVKVEYKVGMSSEQKYAVLEIALAKLKNKTKRSNLMDEIEKNSYFKKPSVLRRERKDRERAKQRVENRNRS